MVILSSSLFLQKRFVKFVPKLNAMAIEPKLIVHVSKGIEPDSLKRISEMIAEELDPFENEGDCRSFGTESCGRSCSCVIRRQ